jgi:hypothetical protein
MALEGTTNRYRCTAYHDYAGSVTAEGEFVLCRLHWDGSQKKASFEPASSRVAEFGYDAFDGETIYLAESLALIADGWINYPDEEGGAKRLFEMGEPRGEDVRYE